jgi:acetyl esterase
MCQTHIANEGSTEVMELVWAAVLEDRLHHIEGLPAPELAPPTPELLARLAAWDAPAPGYVVPDVMVSDLDIPGPRGAVEARVYRPQGTACREGIMWLHGGGFAMGDLNMPEADVVSRELCERANAVVVSVDYRKAHPGQHYPICHDDVFAAWRWITEISQFVEGTWSLGGASAGASLAAATTQWARDTGAQLPSSLLLIYPAVHAVVPEGSDEYRAVMAEVPARVTFPRPLMEAINFNYVGQNPVDLQYAFPAEGNLSDFPRTLIVNCEFDTLRASGEQLAEDLYKAGCDITCVMEPGVPHGHLNTPGLPSALHTIDTMVSFIEKV